MGDDQDLTVFLLQLQEGGQNLVTAFLVLAPEDLVESQEGGGGRALQIPDGGRERQAQTEVGQIPLTARKTLDREVIAVVRVFSPFPLFLPIEPVLTERTTFFGPGHVLSPDPPRNATTVSCGQREAGL